MVVENVPALQPAHVALAVANQVPALQLTLIHTFLELAATIVEKVPALQLTHCVARLADDHVPAPQFRQVADEVAPCVVEYVPALQLMH